MPVAGIRRLGGSGAGCIFVAHPAYPDQQPRVALDQAHHNFHTLEGRYRPFGELLSSDGYAVVPNTEAFSAASLAAARVLGVANAMGGEGTDQAAIP
jgi:hypothetical protein